ncbi:hypothetical protein GUP44_003821 [Salmonella enterica]|nr:hypothetical protein [Salmonella enterica]
MEAVRQESRAGMNYVVEAMKEWRQNQRRQVMTVRDPLPPELHTVIQEAGQHFWTSARQLANESLDAARSAFESEKNDLIQLSAEQSAAFESQATELAITLERLAELERQAAEAGESVREMSQALEAARGGRTAGGAGARPPESRSCGSRFADGHGGTAGRRGTAADGTGQGAAATGAGRGRNNPADGAADGGAGRNGGRPDDAGRREGAERGGRTGSCGTAGAGGNGNPAPQGAGDRRGNRAGEGATGGSGRAGSGGTAAGRTGGGADAERGAADRAEKRPGRRTVGHDPTSLMVVIRDTRPDDYSPGCITMQAVKINPARSGRFFGWFVAGFT